MPKCLWVLVNFNLNATAALWNQSGPGRQIKWMSILQVEWWKEAKRPCLPLWTADVTAIEWGWMAFVTLSDVVIISVWMALESHLNIVLVVSCRDWPFRELSLCFYYLISFFFLFFLSLLLLLLSFISTRLPPFRKSPIQQWRILTRTRGGSQPSFFFVVQHYSNEFGCSTHCSEFLFGPRWSTIVRTWKQILSFESEFRIVGVWWPILTSVLPGWIESEW